MFLKIFALVKVIDEFDLKILVNILNHDDTKCERHARERHVNVKSFHACVFLLSNSEKLRENIQNNTKTKQH